MASAISFQASLRTPVVNQGAAWQLQSLRSLNAPDIINPQPIPMGDGTVAELGPAYGRQAAPLSVMDRTVGDDPLLMMETENLVSRPLYSTYLNVPEGIGNEQQDIINEGHYGPYDTLTGRKTVGRNNAYGLYAGMFPFSPNMKCKSGLGISETECQQAIDSVISRRRNNNFMYTLE